MNEEKAMLKIKEGAFPFHIDRPSMPVKWNVTPHGVQMRFQGKLVVCACSTEVDDRQTNPYC
ncbi:hypothetical protein [Pantoea sp. AS142]